MTSFAPGHGQDFRFQVRGSDGRAVTRFAVVHDKPMHLVVARRDLSGYQHLHPVMAPDGTWSVRLILPEPGVWRAYADFTALDATGRQSPVTLGVDLAAPGGYTPDRCRRRRGADRDGRLHRRVRRRAASRAGATAAVPGGQPTPAGPLTWPLAWARTGTWWRCARVISGMCTCLPSRPWSTER